MGKASRRKGLSPQVAGVQKTSGKADVPANSYLPKYSSVIVIVTTTFITFLIYSNTLFSPFYFDDENNIIVNYKLRDLSNLWPPSGIRYIGYFSFALNYHFGQLDVFGYHLVNIAIHIINGLLVWWLVLLTFKTPVMEKSSSIAQQKYLIAVVSALIFISHPVQTQAVTYIVQRFTSLATLFYLLSLILYIKARFLFVYQVSTTRGQKQSTIPMQSILCYLASLLSTVLAMMTKEIAFTLPFTIILYDLIFFSPWDTEHQTSSLKRLCLFIPFLLTLPIIPFSLIGANRSLGNTITDLGGAIQETEEIPRSVYLLTQFRVIITYIRLLFLPVGQNLDYDFPLSHSLFDPHTLISFLFLLSIFVAALYLLKRSWKTANGYGLLASFGILWFFITLSIESSIIPIRDIAFEHRLYLPSVGAIIAFSSAVFYLFDHTKTRLSPLQATGVLLLFTVVPLSIAAYQRNLVWKDEGTLWGDVVLKSPNKARGHNNLGLAHYHQGQLEEAAKEYNIAVRLKPDYAEAHNNLGLVYYKQGDLSKAILVFQEANQLDPDYVKAYNNLGSVYKKAGRLEEALQAYKTALRLKPDFAEAHYNLGLVYYNLGRLEEAVQEYLTALKLKPDYLEAHQNLAGVYVNQARLDEAVQELMTVLRLNPNLADAHYDLGNLYKTKGLKAEAKREFETVLELRPNDQKARQAIESLSGKGSR